MPQSTLKNITEIQTGIYAKGSLSADTVYLQVNDFDKDLLILHTAQPSISLSKKNHFHYLKEGDLLFAAKGTHNFCTLFSGHPEKCVVSSSFLVIRATKPSIAQGAYINWFLNLPSTLHRLRTNAVGSSIPSITKTILEDIEIPLPSLAIQNKIVALAQLQAKEKKLIEKIAIKQSYLMEYKLKKIISHGI